MEQPLNRRFEDSIASRAIPKGTILLKEGEICTSGYLVVKGCLKSYVHDASGKEIIVQFAPENWIISDLDSVTNKTKSNLTIQAIEDSIIKEVSYESVFTMENLPKDTLLAINEKFKRNIISLNRRLIAILTTSAEQRYMEFQKTYPSLVQRVPLKQIASYIGITPEYLSEIRRKQSKQ